MISAIILAAGESSRMVGQNKLLLPFGNVTLVEHIVDTVLRSNVGEVIVVLGHESIRVKKVLANHSVKFIQNDDYKIGMTTSIHAGVKAIATNAKGIMICLSDLPLIKTDELNHLIRSFDELVNNNHMLIVIPVSKGQRGNPVTFSSHYKNDILNHYGLMGCKGIVKQNPAQVVEIEMDSDHVLIDIDTIEGYEKIVEDT